MDQRPGEFPRRERDFDEMAVFEKTSKKQPPGTRFGTENGQKSTPGRAEIAKKCEKSSFLTIVFFDVFFDAKKIEKNRKMGDFPYSVVGYGDPRTAGGKERKGKPSSKAADVFGLTRPVPRWGTANLNRCARSPYPRGNPAE